MKRLFLILACICVSMHAEAQLIDSTHVQICAYWMPGDSYSYDYTETEYTISGLDTLEVTRSTAIHKYEVLAMTDSTYLMQLTYLDEYSSDEDVNWLNELGIEKFGPTKVLFTTDEFGSILYINNLDDLTAKHREMIEPTVDRLFESGKMESEGITKEAMLLYMDLSINKETIEESIYDDIGDLLYFHGGYMEIGNTYSFPVEIKPFLPGIIERSISSEIKISADEESTDEYSAVLSATICLDEDDIKNAIYSSNMSKFLEETTIEVTEEDKKEFEELLRESTADLHISFEEYSVAEIHLGTGWTLANFYRRTIKSDNAETGESITAEVKKSLDIILEDE